MKGMVFNLLEDFVVENFGQDVFEDIYSSTSLQTTDPFVGPATYPDADFLSLVGTTCQKLNIPLDQAVRGFGKYCFPKLVAIEPSFVNNPQSAKEFLKTVHDIIHVEVKKLHPDAELPSFEYRDTDPQKLEMIYSSPKNLCLFAEGLIEGCAEHYKEKITYHQSECSHKGDTQCVFKLEFS
ncbi:MAG: heme NO-binding domain-containing protein [Oligoflexales bacterium]